MGSMRGHSRQSGSRFISLGGSLQEGLELKCSWERIQRAPERLCDQSPFSSRDQSLSGEWSLDMTASRLAAVWCMY
jgi:hypothetical protein